MHTIPLYILNIYNFINYTLKLGEKNKSDLKNAFWREKNAYRTGEENSCIKSFKY